MNKNAKKMTPEQRADYIRDRHKKCQRKLSRKRRLVSARSFVKNIITLHEYGISVDQIANTILDNNIRLTNYKEETFDNGIHIDFV